MSTYTKTNWAKGDLITHEKLNKIEDQLETVTPGATGSVRYDKMVSISSIEKSVARNNIDAVGSAELQTLQDAIDLNDTSLEILQARMDEFTSLAEGSTTGDSELQDIRVGDDAVTYDAAGTAVRTQFHQVKDDISSLTDRIAALEELNVKNKGMVYLGENSNIRLEEGSTGNLKVYLSGRLNFRYKGDFATPKNWEDIGTEIINNLTVEENGVSAIINIPYYSALVYNMTNEKLYIRRYHNSSTFQFKSDDSILLANAYRKPICGLLFERWEYERANDAANATGFIDFTLNEAATAAYNHIINSSASADSFLYFTDYKRDPNFNWTNRLKDDLAVVKKYITLLPVQFSVFGGGWNTDGRSNAVVLENLRQANISIRNYFNNIHVVVGARDLNTNGISDENAVDGGNISSLVNSKLSLQKPYYTFSTDNITYIVLNSGRTDTNVLTDAEYNYEINTFLPQALASAQTEAIVIFANMIYSSVTVEDNNFSGVLSPVGEAILNKINTATHNSPVIAIFTGYNRQDFITEVNGIKVIGTTTFLDEGTSKYALDIVTIDLSSNKIYCDRLGSNGTSREINL